MGGVAGAGLNFHKSGGLILDLGELVAVCLCGLLSCRAAFNGEFQILAVCGRLILGSVGRFNDNHLRVVAICIGAAHCRFNLIVKRHAVPYAVDGFSVKLHDFVVPIDLGELNAYADALAEGLCHVGIKSDPVARLVLIIHRLEIGNSYDKRALPLNIGKVAVGLGLGFGGCVIVVVFIFAAACKAYCHHHNCEQKCDNFFHFYCLISIYFVITLL